MADPVLHIKDSYYFEVPKVLYPYDYRTAAQFPDVWVSLDPDFQEWEADRLIKDLTAYEAKLLPPQEALLHDWHHYVHADHANFAKPLDQFLEDKYQAQRKAFDQWKASEVTAAQAADKEKHDASVEKAKKLDFDDYVKHLQETGTPDEAYLKFLAWRNEHKASFEQARTEAGGQRPVRPGEKSAIQLWKDEVREGRIADWSKDKITDYNKQLSGRILIPQPFATLRNFYEPESGFAISKYMIIELVVGLIILLLFSRLAQQLAHGKPPKGKLWNVLEVFLVFIRDQVVRPSLGGHHEEDSVHPEHGHELGSPYAEHGHADHGMTAEQLERQQVAGLAAGHGHAAHARHAHDRHANPADRFVPLLWTVFFFVLGCNLMGMVPWAGAPTAAFSVTLALAAITFATVIVSGMLQFGVVGFFLNQVPGMNLPAPMGFIIKPMIFLIEMLGLCIKHGVLAVRLLANMVAGHLVILGIMGLAFGAEAALNFAGEPHWKWGLTAVIAVVASAAFNVLELFVAFLQAYIITFLSALFIGAAIHKH
jgi:F-type H+-transporting ATPase subunit a